MKSHKRMQKCMPGLLRDIHMHLPMDMPSPCTLELIEAEAEVGCEMGREKNDAPAQSSERQDEAPAQSSAGQIGKNSKMRPPARRQH
eukprot:1142841-Pelagomonas_calceolata.AAC.7